MTKFFFYFFHCDYCFKLIFLIYLIIEELELDKEKGKLKINSRFNISTEAKLKFIKNNRCFFSSGDPQKHT